jgi:hypothetical protein
MLEQLLAALQSMAESQSRTANAVEALLERMDGQGEDTPAAKIKRGRRTRAQILADEGMPAAELRDQPAMSLESLATTATPIPSAPAAPAPAPAVPPLVTPTVPQNTSNFTTLYEAEGVPTSSQLFDAAPVYTPAPAPAPAPVFAPSPSADPDYHKLNAEQQFELLYSAFVPNTNIPEVVDAVSDALRLHNVSSPISDPADSRLPGDNYRQMSVAARYDVHTRVLAAIAAAAAKRV